MNEFNYNRNYKDNMSYDGTVESVSETALINKVYQWMCFALAITGVTSYGVAGSPALFSLIYGNPLIFYGLIIGELALVISLSAAINKLSSTAATMLFILYSVINGATLASIFLIYEIGSIVSTFFVAAGTFGAMALYGSKTKKDLTSIGNLCYMAVIGLIIAMVVNMFVHSTMLELIVSVIGVIVFVGITAYDAQKLKHMFMGIEDNSETQKYAVLGALTIYLDFVNLFLYLLRLLGRKK